MSKAYFIDLLLPPFDAFFQLLLLLKQLRDRGGDLLFGILLDMESTSLLFNKQLVQFLLLKFYLDVLRFDSLVGLLKVLLQLLYLLGSHIRNLLHGQKLGPQFLDLEVLMS